MKARSMFLRTSRRRTALAAAAVLAAGGLAAGASVVSSASAAESGTVQQTFDGPDGHHQFVQISTRELPFWGASMVLYDWQGNQVYTWEYGLDGTESGGKKTWWFTAGRGSRIEVLVGASDGIGFTKNEVRKTFWFEPGSPDGYCFHVNPMGSVSYTGDSNTGGCTPD